MSHSKEQEECDGNLDIQRQKHESTLRKHRGRHDNAFLTVQDLRPHEDETEIFFLHVAFDITGNHAIAGNSIGEIFKFDLRRMTYLCIFELKLKCTAISCTPLDGQDIIVALSDNSIICMDSITKRKKTILKDHRTHVKEICIDNLSSKILSYSDKQAILLDLQTLSLLCSVPIKKDTEILKALLLPIRSYVVVACSDSVVSLWNCSSAHRIGHFTIDEEEGLETIAGSNDGDFIVCGGRPSWIKVWSVSERTFLISLEFDKNFITVKDLSVLYSSKESESHYTFSLLTKDGMICVYDLDSGNLLHHISLDDGWIIRKTVSHDGNKIAVISSLGMLKFYDISEIGKPIIQVAPNLDNEAIDDVEHKEQEPSRSQLNRKRKTSGSRSSSPMSSHKRRERGISPHLLLELPVIQDHDHEEKRCNKNSISEDGFSIINEPHFIKMKQDYDNLGRSMKKAGEEWYKSEEKCETFNDAINLLQNEMKFLARDLEKEKKKKSTINRFLAKCRTSIEEF